MGTLFEESGQTDNVIPLDVVSVKNATDISEASTPSMKPNSLLHTTKLSTQTATSSSLRGKRRGAPHWTVIERATASPRTTW